MQFDRQTRRAHQVNLTPLIDVVFLLIVFFMLSTSFAQIESIELTLPSGTKRTASSGDVMHMLVKTDNQVEVDGNRYDVNRLDRLIRQALKHNPEQKMLLLSTPGVTVQQLVTVMDLVYVNGGKNVQIDHYYTGSSPDIGQDVKMTPER